METILTFALAFGIQFSTLMAGNIGDKMNPNQSNRFNCPECVLLAPTVPMQASFGEITDFDATMNLVPDVPLEAEFDKDIEVELATNNFAPSIPLQADFFDTL